MSDCHHILACQVWARGQKELATQNVVMTLVLTPNFIFFNIPLVIMLAQVKVSYY